MLPDDNMGNKMHALTRTNLPCKSSPIGAAVRATREALGISQAELAERAGMTRAHLSRLETGDRRRINVEVLARIESALGLMPCALMPRPRVDASLEDFLAGPIARDLGVTGNEAAALRSAVWYGPGEQPSALAWQQLLLARRALRARTG